MCGIIGIYNTEHPVQIKLLTKMNDTLTHRGPDDSGIYIDKNIGLGHRRLSIIDLSDKARQPMSNEDQTIWLSFNGEIYNFQKIKKNLNSKGHIFKSNTDAEVLIHLYEEDPNNFLDKVIGMFAFIIWDKKKKQLIVARDRLGQKPLYYFYNPKNIIFASEIKAILKAPEVPIEINEDSLLEFLAFRFNLGEKTIFKQIYKVLPGEIIRVSEGKFIKKNYWNIPLTFKPDNQKTIINRYLSIFESAVKLRLVSDVPLGAFLSGGIDSTSVVYAMTKFSKKPVKTFTAIFEPNISHQDESKFAKMASDFFKTEHYEKTCSIISLLDNLPKIVYHLDEPISDPAVVPTYLLFESARNYLKVILTGEGSDEINAGYFKYIASNLIQRFLSLPSGFSSLLKKIISYLPNYAYLSPLFALSKEETWKYLSLLFGKELNHFLTIKELIDKSLNQRLNNSLLHDNIYYKIDKSIHPLQRLFYLDIKGWLASDLLLKVDKMGMAHSIEPRAPFLDHRLVEYSMSIPPNKKIGLFKTKKILRASMKGKIPPKILKRKQHGFIVPFDIWFVKNSHRYLVAKFEKLKKRGVVNPKAIDLLKRYLQGDLNLRGIIWRLLMLEIWFEVFIDGLWKDLN
jgi:asparagine synthase (glutamine-hydrolysing)